MLQDPENVSSVLDHGSDEVEAIEGNRTQKEGEESRPHQGEDEIDYAQKCKRNKPVCPETAAGKDIGVVIEKRVQRIENRIEKRAFLEVHERESANCKSHNHCDCTNRCHEDVGSALFCHTVMITF